MSQAKTWPQAFQFDNWEATDLGNCPQKAKRPKKWSGEGAAGLHAHSEPKASCAGAKWVCTVADEVWGGARDSWEGPLLPGSIRP